MPEPIGYGYSGGWDNIVNCAAFLVFAILAVCVTLAPTFSSEYQSGADAVVLATQVGPLVARGCQGRGGARLRDGVLRALRGGHHGRVACLLRCGRLWALHPEHGALLALPAHGGPGGARPGGLMYVACLGFACLTLALSSRTPSTLAVFLTDVVLVLLTGLVPSGGVGSSKRVLALFPINFANFSVPFSALESYPLGPLVLDLIGMVLLVYAALALVATPVAVVSFREAPGGVGALLPRSKV